MEKLFKELTELAKEYRSFAEKQNGWSDTNYEKEEDNLYVRCYFASNSDFTTVTFGGFRKQLQVSFHSLPSYEIDLAMTNEQELTNMRDTYTAYLKKLKSEYIEKTEKEREEEKQRKIELLEKELQTLKGGMTEEQLIEREKVSSEPVTKDSTIL